jgi:phage shock protein PspC (stress-responsive transcriptional regulator)
MSINRPYLPVVYRDSSTGWITGVFAGLSEITGVRPLLLRLSALIATYLFPLIVVPAYLMAFLLLRDRARFESSFDETEPAALDAPHVLLADYGVLQHRLANLEAEVTSGDAELRRRFRDAGLA